MPAVSLPYVDNARAILITLTINLAAVFVCNWPQGVTYAGLMWDSLFCALITTIISMWIVYPRLKRLRTLGAMPAQAPESGFMQRLPQNPLALGAICALAFAALMIGVNAAFWRFFGIQKLSFAPWTVYKLVYATVLSAKIVECCIFRYVQPDWAYADSGAHAGTRKELSGLPVRHPLPSIGVLKEMYGSVAGNIALNIVIASIFGSVALAPDGSVVIRPTSAEAMPVTGIVFGLLAGIFVTNGVVKEMNAAIIASYPAILEGPVRDRRFAWMPRDRVPLACLMCLVLMVFSAVALPAAMGLFDIPRLNFFQFTVFITVYATIISKPLACVLIRRCMQPDYIRHTLRQAKLTE